ncbi:unnamed protein product, partial [Brenthis ino]
MAFKGWYSKQDVMKDLSKASGTRVSDLDEEYVVVGEQPPPFYRTADKEEELQLLRLYGGHQPLSPNNTDIVEPDLEGITQMLRMVDEYNDSPVNNKAKETKKQDTNTVITISKLNPNVAEFVPRSDDDICNKDSAIVANNDLVVSEVDEEKHNRRTSEHKSTEARDRSINTLSNKSISIKDSNEIKEMREKLKTKITNTFNTSCVKVKRERNLAIAMLVKLHTQPNNEINNDGQKPKLMTPDYFKKSVNHDAKMSGSDKSSNKNTNSNTPVVFDDIDMCKDTKDDIKDYSNNNSNSNDEIMQRESPVSDNLNNSMTKEIKESIQKVDDWLNPKINAENKTSAITRPSLYLGPITFKRKTNSKPMSPISVESELKSQNSEKSNEVFVPSTFASELTKKYEERNKARDNQLTNQDIWTKLESDLKVRDEVIKKKRLQTNAD